jgi:hypothetical protein
MSKRARSKKVHPTIIVAVIALIGMVIGAILAGPVLIALIQKTPPPTATLPPLTIFPETGALLGLVTDLSHLDALEYQAGKKHSVIKIYQAFWHNDFWEDFANLIQNREAIEFLSLDPLTKVGGRETGLNSCEVLSGDYDNSILNYHVCTTNQRLGTPTH